MSKPQPIETAPRDGTVILTDFGFVKFRSHHPAGQKYWMRAENGEWWCCSPLYWIPIPHWMRNLPEHD